jgi:hypothetical protein
LPPFSELVYNLTGTKILVQFNWSLFSELGFTVQVCSRKIFRFTNLQIFRELKSSAHRGNCRVCRFSSRPFQNLLETSERSTQSFDISVDLVANDETRTRQIFMGTDFRPTMERYETVDLKSKQTTIMQLRNAPKLNLKPAFSSLNTIFNSGITLTSGSKFRSSWNL